MPEKALLASRPKGDPEVMVIVHFTDVPFPDGVNIHSSGMDFPGISETWLRMYDPKTTESTSIDPLPTTGPSQLYFEPMYPGTMSNVHCTAVSALIHGSQAVRSTNPATKWNTFAGGRLISSVVVILVSFGMAKPMTIRIASNAMITIKIHFRTFI